MPDVDEAVRKLTEACTTDFYNQSNAFKRVLIDAFCRIPDKNRPLFTRGKTNSQIEGLFNRLYIDVKKKISEYFGREVLFLKEDSKNNKKGSDLIATIRYGGYTKDERIELKFGQETLKAIGLESFDKIFMVDSDRHYFETIFTIVKEKQREFALQNRGKVDLLIANLERQLYHVIKGCNEKVRHGSLNINSWEMAKQLSSTGSVRSGEPLIIPTKFKIGWNSITVSEKLDLSGIWKITEISPSKEKGARINFIATNGKVETKFLLHWKNDMVFDGFKYPARTGINSYCFNVWAWRKK